MKKNVFLLGLISVLFYSCSDDNTVVDDGAGAGDGKAYLSLNLAFPDNTVTARSTTVDEGGDGYQQGLSTEQKFQKVLVTLVDEGGKIVNTLNYTADDFAPDGNSAPDDNTTQPSPTPGSRKYLLKAPAIVNKGSVFVYVFLNPTAELLQKLTVGETVDVTMSEEITKLTSSDITTSYAKPDNFLMGNAHIPTLTLIDGVENNPTIIQLDVERFAAKLVENTTTTSFNVVNKMGATSLTAAFVNYNYNFLNKRAFYLKQTQAISLLGAYSGAYVVDPNFVQKDYLAFLPESPFYGNDFFIVGNKGINKAFAATPQINYSLENTMISNEQYVNKTTSIVYKAALSVNGSANTTFYTYKYTVYPTYDALAAAYNADYPATPNALQAIFVEQDVANAYGSSDQLYSSAVKSFNKKLEDEGLRCYYNGECYYNWPIKHWQQDVLMGRMEFAVVRNNVYYLSVKAINNIGDPWVPAGPEDPGTGVTPPLPDEMEKAYLSVEITVLPWVVRSNDIEF